MSKNRLIDAIMRIIRSEFPNYSYIGVYEYSIQSVDGDGDNNTTIDAEPTDTTLSLPAIQKLLLKPSIIGATAKPSVGKLCYIMFANGKPNKAICISCEGIAQKIELDAEISIKLAAGLLGVARVGDTVQAGPYAGTITSGSTKVTCG